MRIAYLTAGAAGMYCGSCLHDNALAKAMIRQGHDAVLIPTYTPIQTDEVDASSKQLFFGGLNVYLQQISPIFRRIPNWADRFLSSPRLVKAIASRAMGTSAENLGALTVSMLKGMDGNQRKEVQRLCAWLEEFRPDVVVFSNLLIAGCIPQIQATLGCPTVVILQGDDIFYESLVEPYRQQAHEELRRLAGHVDRFVMHSEAYSQRMQTLLGYTPQQSHVIPISIDISDYQELNIKPDPDRNPTIGYLARLAPEKGLHSLVDAFIDIHRSHSVAGAKLAVAGWLGKQHEKYWQKQLRKLDAAGLSDDVKYHGSVDRQGKLQFLESIDVLCVPTTYHEPKGLFVLEALAAGVPYVQPAHGAFPEIHKRAQGGYLFDPERPHELAHRLTELLENRPKARLLGTSGRDYVVGAATVDHEAELWTQLLDEICLPKSA